jgi:hypothetical protein
MEYDRTPWSRYIDEIIEKLPPEQVECCDVMASNERVKREVGVVSLPKLCELHRRVKKISSAYTRS